MTRVNKIFNVIEGIIARDININIQSENSNWSANVFIFINLK